jgi:hypothetical protein
MKLKAEWWENNMRIIISNGRVAFKRGLIVVILTLLLEMSGDFDFSLMQLCWLLSTLVVICGAMEDIYAVEILGGNTNYSTIGIAIMGISSMILNFGITIMRALINGANYYESGVKFYLCLFVAIEIGAGLIKAILWFIQACAIFFNDVVNNIRDMLGW